MPTKNTKVTPKDIPHTCILPNHNPAAVTNDNTTMGQTLAVITLITIPVIIIYALFSKQIVEGVVSTGSKEG